MAIDKLAGKVWHHARPTLLNGTASEFRHAMKLRAELLGETDNTVAVKFVDGLNHDS